MVPLGLIFISLTVTEDYSSYESVDEEEPEDAKPKKGSKTKKPGEGDPSTSAVS